MKFSEIVDLAHDVWQSGRLKTFCLLGPPGVGKSSIGFALAERIGGVCVSKDLTSLPLEDIPGLPKFADDKPVVRHVPLEWMYELCQPDAIGVLVLDDLPAAPPAIQVATRQLALYRTLNGHRLSDKVFILVTGNRREDRSAASTLPAHFTNAVAMYQLEVDFNEWCTWYLSQAGYDPIVPRFLASHRAQPDGGDLLSMLPTDADEKGSFPTPRSWADFGYQLPSARKFGHKAVRETAAGWVGQGAATAFMAFFDAYEHLPDPVAVLKQPHLFDPGILDRPDKTISVVVGLAQAAVTLGREEGMGQTCGLLFKALGHVTVNQDEYAVMGLNSYLASGGTKDALMEGAKVSRGDPATRRLFFHLQELA